MIVTQPPQYGHPDFQTTPALDGLTYSDVGNSYDGPQSLGVIAMGPFKYLIGSCGASDDNGLTTFTYYADAGLTLQLGQDVIGTGDTPANAPAFLHLPAKGPFVLVEFAPSTAPDPWTSNVVLLQTNRDAGPAFSLPTGPLIPTTTLGAGDTITPYTNWQGRITLGIRADGADVEVFAWYDDNDGNHDEIAAYNVASGDVLVADLAVPAYGWGIGNYSGDSAIVTAIAYPSGLS